jgi:hypothetical protein
MEIVPACIIDTAIVVGNWLSSYMRTRMFLF